MKYIENGCCITYNWDSKYWYKFGKKHRDDGPAIETLSGDKSYYLNGKRYSEEEEYWEEVNTLKSQQQNHQ